VNNSAYQILTPPKCREASHLDMSSSVTWQKEDHPNELCIYLTKIVFLSLSVVEKFLDCPTQTEASHLFIIYVQEIKLDRCPYRVKNLW
jgi:hypothetical protein